MNFDTLKNIIREENHVLTDFFSILKNLQEAIINQKKEEEIKKILLNIDKKSFEFNKIDSKRDEVINLICNKNNIEKKIEPIVSFLSEQDKECAMLMSEFIENLNELSINLSSLHDLIGFQQNFNNMMIKLINIDKTGKTTYGKKGYNNTFNPSNTTWRG